jgi:hypothetical protein
MTETESLYLVILVCRFIDRNRYINPIGRHKNHNINKIDLG